MTHTDDAIVAVLRGMLAECNPVSETVVPVVPESSFFESLALASLISTAVLVLGVLLVLVVLVCRSKPTKTLEESLSSSSALADPEVPVELPELPTEDRRLVVTPEEPAREPPELPELPVEMLPLAANPPEEPPVEQDPVAESALAELGYEVATESLESYSTSSLTSTSTDPKDPETSNLSAVVAGAVLGGLIGLVGT